uniref:RRM domain-containing protein n=1 Tax=Fagus sylvatica TaxID=28930 RepID=A0A2N9F2P3_FAGSY
MESDEAKLFVGGISRETSEQTLKKHFDGYGTVLGSSIAKDRLTRNPRGFGFVWFSDPSAALKALQDSHVILGKTVEVKKAIPRSEPQYQYQNQQQQHYQNQQQNNRGVSKISSGGDNGDNQFRTKKIFVGGLSASLTEEEFKNYFERFGRVTDVVVMHDSITHRPRGFGFVTFDSEESLQNVMQNSFHELNGRLVEVKRAVPKDANNGSDNGFNSRIEVGRGSSGSYSPYNPRYWVLPGYASFPGFSSGGGSLYGPNIYSGWYPTGGYGGVGSGVAPLAPRNPWYGPGVMDARSFMLPYGNASIYPAPLNGGVGVMGMAAGGYNGIVGQGVNWKLNQVLGVNELPADVTPPRIEGVKSDADSSGLKRRNGATSSKQNQRGLNG